MRRRAIVVTALLLLGLLAPAVPASAAGRATLSGRVLDENGRAVRGATVRFYATVTKPAPERDDSILGTIFWGFGCLLSLGFVCSDGSETRVVLVRARTDAAGRYAFRFDPGWQLGAQWFEDVEVTRAALIRGTLAPKTSTDLEYHGGRTLPTFRLWLRGASIDKVSTTHRRIRPSVPKALGAHDPFFYPVRVELVQGAKEAWDYGEVDRVRTVDARVVETGTTGTQTFVTTKVGSRYVWYRSGVRPVTKVMRPLSRGKRCYGYRGLTRVEQPRCPLTDGRLAVRGDLAYTGRDVDIDLGRLANPEAYVVRGCPVYGVAGSVDGIVFVDFRTEQREKRVLTGKPPVPVRYVRLDLGSCKPAEVSVFGAPFPDL